MADLLSIEILFDARTEERVRSEWDALAALGVSSLAAHTERTNRPHATLIAGAPHDLVSEIDLPIRITLGAPVLFGDGDRRVLARSVIPSTGLLELQKKVHALAAGRPVDPHFTPGRWMPHVTLARRIRISDLPRALEFIGDEISGEAVALRSWNPGSRTTRVIAGRDPHDAVSTQ